MLTRVITLRFNGLLDAFDDGPLRDFIKDKELISVRDHFFIHRKQPYLAMTVNYTLKPAVTEAAVSRPGKESKPRDESWKELLTEADMPLFNTLRDWRTARARRDGVPVYVICDNQELAAIVAARPATLAALGEIKGIGKAKLERYGADLLALLARGPAEAPSPVEAANPAAETGQ
jgi:ATP-dependent DNA helicase RecQ